MGSPGQTPPAHCAVRLFDQQYPVNLTTLPASSSSNDGGSNNAGSSGGGADKVSFTDMIAGSSVRMRLFLSALSLCLSRACLGKTIVFIYKCVCVYRRRQSIASAAWYRRCPYQQRIPLRIQAGQRETLCQWRGASFMTVTLKVSQNASF